MNYYYEENMYVYSITPYKAVKRYDIMSNEGEKIAESMTEENANLIVTLMNHGQKTEEYQHGWPESPLP